MICNNCGSSLNEAANFCNACGAATTPANFESYGGTQAGNQTPASPVSALWSDPPQPAPKPSVACIVHAALVAAGTCVGCGNFYCRGCLVSSQGRNYCQRCYSQYQAVPPPPPPYGYRQNVPSYGYSNQPPLPQSFPYQPPAPSYAQPYAYPPPLQPYIKRKEPGLALLLSFFMPGVGQIYNGEAGKGIAFFISFWILVWFLFIGVGIWIWSMADAHQTAKNINLGRRV
jgi:TM2 domain-containing membrane protein YozV